MRLALALAALTFSAPAAAKQPYFTGHTQKPAREVAECTAAAWKAADNPFKVRTEVEAGSYTVVLFGSSMFGGKDMQAIIKPDGSVTMKRRPALWGKLDDRLRDALAGCL